MKTALARMIGVLFLIFAPAAQAQYSYTTNANGVSLTITSYSGSGGNVTIPTNINGLVVTSIGEEAFEGSGLSSVTIPGSVTSIGEGAFYYCPNMTNVAIPGSVTNIGDGSFGDCGRLTAITVSASNLYYTSVNGVLFNYAQTTLIQFPGGAGGSYTVPASVTSISSGAFFGANLTAINVSAANLDYSSVGGVLFNKNQTTLIQYPIGASGSYTIPGSVKSIASGAFEYAQSLGNNITIPGSVTSIGEYAFYDCSSLTAITVSAANAYYSSANGVLFNKSQITLIQFPVGAGGSYTIPSTVTTIANGAFGDCLGLTNVTIPGSVTSIGYEAFYSCEGLTSVTMGNGVTSIGEQAFWYCYLLASFTIPSSVASLGENSFAYCYGLSNVYFTGNAPTVGYEPFLGDNIEPTAYYLPGTAGWAGFSTNAGVPVVLWKPVIQTTDGGFGVRTNHFGFDITGTNNLTFVVEACTNLADPVWFPLTTNTLVNGLFYFSEPLQTQSSGRFYALGLP